jgi:hypothetical protein
MKKKMWILVGSIMLSFAVAACNGGEAEVTKTDAAVENVIADAGQTEEEKSSESSAAESGKTENAETDAQEEKESEKKTNYNNYEYILYKTAHSTYDDERKRLMGFNMPEGYTVESFTHAKGGNYKSNTYYAVSLAKDDTERHTYLTIDSWGYEVTDDNKLAFAEWNSLAYNAEEYYDIDLEKKAQVETAYGLADIYFETWTFKDSGKIDYEDVAFLTIDEEVVRITLSQYKNEEYLGELETILPEMLAEKEKNSEKNTVKLQSNRVQAEEGDYNSILLDQLGETAVLGFNNLDGWGDFPGSFTSYLLYKDTGNVSLSISTDEVLVKHYYEEDASYGAETYGTLLEKTEEGTLSTPFGDATVYYVKSEVYDNIYEEEIALLNNMGSVIVFRYIDMGSGIYDGEYDAHLEDLFGQLFSE